MRDTAEKGTGTRDAAGVRSAGSRAADPRPRDRKRPEGVKSGKPKIDIVKTRTWFTAKHESDSTTKSWSTTEETSRTSTTSHSRTDGVSVGDEITYELVYDHQVQPETLMALPEDQMLAPNIVESAPPVRLPVTGRAESKMVALVIDPSIVGTEQVAPVRPGEIPAFEPPVPAISAQVPDYERVPRPAIGA